jgi:hypothetical protein
VVALRGGLRRLVHPATSVKDIDIDGTRADRQRMREALRRRQELFERLRDELLPAEMEPPDAPPGRIPDRAGRQP